MLNNRDGVDATAALTVELPRMMLSEFALGQIEVQDITGPEATFTGDKQLLFDLAALLDIFPAWFPIATHALKFGETHP